MYATDADCPPDVRKRFPGHCTSVWRTTWNDTFTRHADETRAFATAEIAGKSCMEAGAMNQPTKAMMPTDAAAMREHLAAAPPDGHGTDCAGMSMADCTAKHDAMHAAGADHTHPTKSIKFIGDSSDTIEGLAIPFSGPLTGGKDFDGEYFSKSTDLCLEWFSERPILYDHGTNGETKTSVIGRQTEATVTDDGVWVKAELDKNSRYRQRVDQLIAKDALAFSSGAMPHLVKVGKSGHIERWPWVELSATPTAANTLASFSYAVKSADAIAHLGAIMDMPESLSALIGALDDGAATKSGLEHGPYTEHGQRVLADLSAFVERTSERALARDKVGRVLSAANRALLSAYLEQLDTLAGNSGEIRKLLRETDPEAEKSAIAVLAEFAAIEARIAGVNV